MRDGETVREAMRVMDEGYLAQYYYSSRNAMIPLTRGREETYTLKDYSWTEHISRKLGQWSPDPKGLLKQLEKRGFHITRSREEQPIRIYSQERSEDDGGNRPRQPQDSCPGGPSQGFRGLY